MASFISQTTRMTRDGAAPAQTVCPDSATTLKKRPDLASQDKAHAWSSLFRLLGVLLGLV